MKQKIRSLTLILAVLALIAAGLACRRREGAATPVVLVVTATPGGPAQATLPPAPTSTPVPGGCADGMAFVTDVTVPDGAIFDPNESFIKTWRIRNGGSCNWTGYHVAFSAGEPMGTMDQAIPDTPAGEELDISIEMTAPGGAGSYTGSWQVRSSAGAVLGTLTCVIVVQGAEPPPPDDQPEEPPDDQPEEPPPDDASVTPPTNLQSTVEGSSVVITWEDGVGEAGYVLIFGIETVNLSADTTSYTWENPQCGAEAALTLIAHNADRAEIGRLTGTAYPPGCAAEPHTVGLNSLAAEDGYVRGVTSGESVALNGDVSVGDGSQNGGNQAFFSFDITGIPAGATIQSAILDLSGHTREGTPFASLGRLRAYHNNYDTLDVGDFVAGFPGGMAEWTAPPGTVDVTAQVAQALGNDRTRFQIRLQFENATNNDNLADRLTFPEGGPALTITYAP